MRSLGFVLLAGCSAVAPPPALIGSARVSVTDADGVPIEEFTTIWHDKHGQLLDVLTTDANGISTLEISAGATVTAVFSATQPYLLGTHGELNPGDTWRIRFVRPSLITGTMTFTLPSFPGASVYQLDNACVLTRSSALGGTLHMWDTCITEANTFHTLATASDSDMNVMGHLLQASLPVPSGNPDQLDITDPWLTDFNPIALSVSGNGAEAATGILDSMISYDDLWFRLPGQFFGANAAVPQVAEGIRGAVGAVYEESVSLMTFEQGGVPASVVVGESELLAPVTELAMYELNDHPRVEFVHGNDGGSYDTLFFQVRSNTHTWIAMTRTGNDAYLFPELPDELEFLVPTVSQSYIELRVLDLAGFSGWFELKQDVATAYMMQTGVPFENGARMVVAGGTYYVPRDVSY